MSRAWTASSTPSSSDSIWNGKPAPSPYLHKQLDITGPTLDSSRLGSAAAAEVQHRFCAWTLHPEASGLIIGVMAKASWQRRIQRAKELTSQRPFAAEILGFYVQVARFQEGFYQRLENASQGKTEIAPQGRLSGPPELRELVSSFGMFLSVVETSGPARLAEMARDLRHRGDEAWSDCLDTCWSGTQPSPAAPQEFLGRAFLQPYAEFVRSRIATQWNGYTYSLCPFCNRKPGLGILRQLSDSARRSLMCSFCAAEWEFRRIVWDAVRKIIEGCLSTSQLSSTMSG